MVSITSVLNAYRSIKPFIHKTPLIYSTTFSKRTGAEVYLKAENLQKTGSFKVRGAFNKIHSIRGGSVIAASMGNHAQAVAYAAGKLGIAATIVMPVTTATVKQEATKEYGAKVLLYGETFDEALDYALSQKGYTFIHPFDDDEIIAGQGTIGLEINDDLDNIDLLFIPVGGGGLISGISIVVKSYRPATSVIGVQAFSAPSAYCSLESKTIQAVPPSSTLADGIAVGRIGERPFEIMSRYVDHIRLVSEESIAEAMLSFLERKKLVVEGAGAVPLAALLENKEDIRGKRVVLVVSGGNVDFTLMDRIILKGLIVSGKIGIFEVIADDVPNSLHTLTGVLAPYRTNILNVVHDRLAADLPLGKARVIFIVETKGREHLDDIISDLTMKGYEAKKK
ncbi:MAG: threonine ammonia-lyase [Dissulfurispiraceae bacterium]